MSIMPPIRTTTIPTKSARAKMIDAPTSVTRNPIVLMMLGWTRRRTRASTTGFSRLTKAFLNHSGMTLEVRFDHLGETLLADRSDDGFDDVPTLEKQHAGNRPHGEALSAPLVRVDIQLADLEPSPVFLGQLTDRRRDH